MLAAALLACPLSFVGRPGDATTFASSSGRYELAIEPDDDERSATCRMRLDGREQWNVELPFVLELAAVMEDGRVAGCARVIDEKEKQGELLVVLLSPNGELVSRVVRPLQHAGWNHGQILFTPRVDDIVLQPDAGRFVLCIFSQAPSNERGNSLWSYDATTGAQLARQPIGAGKEDTEGFVTGLIGLRAVPNTPLLLLSWSSTDYSVEPQANDSVFQLVDETARVVWTFELSRDFDVSGDWYAELRLKSALRANPPILDVRSRTFELWAVADAQRISFSVERAGDGWQVTEVERGPVTLDGAPPSWIHPRRIGAIAMQSTTAPGKCSGVGRIEPYRGRVLVADTERVVHVLDLLGEELARCTLGAAEPITGLGLTHDGHLVVAGDGRKVVLFAVDATRDSTIDLVADLAVWRTDGAGYWDVRGWTELVRCAPDGTVELQVGERADGRELVGIEALAVGREGRLAVLDRNRATEGRAAAGRSLSIYDSDGTGIRTLPLPDGEPCRSFSYQAQRVVLAGRSSMQLVDLETERLFALDFDSRGLPLGIVHVTLSPDGQELWWLQGLRLVRYSLQE
jgi:hypothetical protein